MSNGTAVLESTRGDRFVFPVEEPPAEEGENAYFSVRRDRIELRSATQGRREEAEPNSVFGTVRVGIAPRTAPGARSLMCRVMASRRTLGHRPAGRATRRWLPAHYDAGPV